MKSSSYSWIKTDIRHFESIEDFPNYQLVKLCSRFIALLYLGGILTLKYYPENFVSLSTRYQVDLDNLHSIDLQKTFLLGSLAGFIVAVLVGGSLMSSLFSHRQKQLGWLPRWLRTDDSVRLIAAVLQSATIAPKGFDTLLSLTIGVFGILLYVLLYVVNAEEAGVSLLITTTMYYLVFFYSTMQGVYSIFNKYALATTILILALITVPHYLFEREVIPLQYEQTVLFWLPILGLNIIPQLFKRRS